MPVCVIDFRLISLIRSSLQTSSSNSPSTFSWSTLPLRPQQSCINRNVLSCDLKTTDTTKFNEVSSSPSPIWIWLHSLQFSCYHPLFISAGYDIQTVSRMTPEDLTAIGIKHPSHRKKMMESISRMEFEDFLPNFVPVGDICITLICLHQGSNLGLLFQLASTSWS